MTINGLPSSPENVKQVLRVLIFFFFLLLLLSILAKGGMFEAQQHLPHLTQELIALNLKAALSSTEVQ
jgi:hypothetical protein